MALEAIISEEALTAGVKFIKSCVGAVTNTVAEADKWAEETAKAVTKTTSEANTSSEPIVDSELSGGEGEAPVEAVADSEEPVATTPEEVAAENTATESCTGLSEPVEEVAVAGKCEGLIPMFKDLARTLASSGVELEDGHPMKALVDAVRAGDQKALDAAAGKLALATQGWQPDAAVDNPGAPDTNKDSLLVKPGDKLVLGVDGSLTYVPADGSSPVGVYNCADKTLGSFGDKEMLDTKPCHGPQCPTPEPTPAPVVEKVVSAPVAPVEKVKLPAVEPAPEPKPAPLAPTKENCDILDTPSEELLSVNTDGDGVIFGTMHVPETGQNLPVLVGDVKIDDVVQALEEGRGVSIGNSPDGYPMYQIYTYDPDCPGTLQCFTWTDVDADGKIDPDEFNDTNRNGKLDQDESLTTEGQKSRDGIIVNELREGIVAYNNRPATVEVFKEKGVIIKNPVEFTRK